MGFFTTKGSCDACRRRKIRCDTKNPCGQCVKFFHDCTYRAATPKEPKRQSSMYESGRKTKSWVPARAIGVSECGPQLMQARVLQAGESTSASQHRSQPDHSAQAQLNNPADSFASSRLIVDRSGVEFLGSSGDRAFLETCREKPCHWPDYATLRQNAPPTVEIPDLFAPGSNKPSEITMPAQDVAQRLAFTALDSHSVFPVLDRDRFLRELDETYVSYRDVGAGRDQSFTALQYGILALGCFTIKRGAKGVTGEETTVDMGAKYLRRARQLIDLAGCRDFATLQAVIVMNFCYMATSRSHVCYTYLCTTMTLATRMGLHQRCTGLPTDHRERESADVKRRAFRALRLLMRDTAICCGLPTLQGGIGREGDRRWLVQRDCVEVTAELFQRLCEIPIRDERADFSESKEGAQTGLLEAAAKAEDVLNEWLRSLSDGYRVCMLPDETRTTGRLKLALGYAYRLVFFYRPSLQFVLDDLGDRTRSNTDDNSAALRYATIAVLACQSISSLCEVVLASDLFISVPVLVPRVLFSSVITLFRTLLTLHAKLGSQQLMPSVVSGTLSLQRLAETSVLGQVYLQSFLGIISTLPGKFAPIRSAVEEACRDGVTSLPGKDPKSQPSLIEINDLVTNVLAISTSGQLSSATADYFKHPGQFQGRERKRQRTNETDIPGRNTDSDCTPSQLIGSRMIHYTPSRRDGRLDTQSVFPVAAGEMGQQPLTALSESGQQQRQHQGTMQLSDEANSGQHEQTQFTPMLDLSAVDDLDGGFLRMNESFTDDLGQGFSFSDWL